MRIKNVAVLLSGILVGIAGFFAVVPNSAFGATILYPVGGGTGSSTLSGILIGNGTSPLNTLTIGSNLTLTGTTLSASGSSGSPFPFTAFANYNATSTAIGFLQGLFSTASSTFNGGLMSLASTTIGAGGQATGLTVSGGATTTGNLSVAGALLGTNAFAVTGTASVSGNISSTGGNVTASGNVQAGSGNGFVWSNGNGIKSSVSGQFIFNNNGSSALTTLSIPASGTLQVGAAGEGTLVSGYHGIGTSTPYALLAVLATSTTGSGAPTTLFAIASTTGGTSTSTLFSISNIGALTQNTTATSSFLGGINLTGTDCVAIGSICLQTYIQSAVAYKSAANYATAAVLPGTPTYSNGSSGVGATLTEVGFGALTVDGQSVSLGNRILVKNQADQTQNGIYTVTTVGSGIASYLLTRSTDYNTSNDVYAGTTVPVLAGGTANGDTVWTESTTGTIAIGSSNITFIESSIGTAADTFAYLFPAANGTATTSPIMLLASTTIGNGLSGGGLTVNGNATTSALNVTSLTSGRIPYVSSAFGTLSDSSSLLWDSTNLKLTATYASTTAVSATATSTFAGGLTDANVKLVNGYNTPGFTITASTTAGVAFVGSTTMLQIPSAFNNELFDNVQCYTDVGTLNVVFGISTASTTLFNASTTQGVITFSTNNKRTPQQKWYVVIGTPVSSPTQLTCALRIENTSY